VPHSTQLDKERIATSTPECQSGVLVVRRHHLLVRCSHWLNVLSAGIHAMTEFEEFAFLGIDGKLLLTLWKQSSWNVQKQTPGLHHLSF